jgi:methyl-accepting chemotaxis protein
MFKLNLKLKVWQRLALGFGVILVFLVGVAAYGVLGLYTNNQITETITQKDWVKTVIANDIVDLANENGRLNLQSIMATDREERAKMQERIVANKGKIDGKLAELEALLYTEKGKQLLAAMKEARKPYVSDFGRITALLDQGKRDEAVQVGNQDLVPKLDRFIKSINDLIAFQGELVDKGSAKAAENYLFTRNAQFVAAFAALVFGGLFAYFTARHFTKATGQLAEAVDKVAAGDSTARSNVKSGDELETLSVAFDKMVVERVGALAQKEKESELLNNSIIDILRSVAKTAQGDLTVRAPVREDITGALSDAINSMSESTAKTLAGVTTMSNEVRSASQDGRDTVLQTSRGMNEIRSTIQETGKRIKRLGERSQEITGIVKLIDDIAERTSVLALNANMQAAMAGEAGRGFRVVADEVQRLAERSKEATDQIGKLVNTIQSETNETMVTMDRAIGEVVKGGELADRAAEKVTHLDELGDRLLQSVQTFKLPEELLKEVAAAAERSMHETRRAA